MTVDTSHHLTLWRSVAVVLVVVPISMAGYFLFHSNGLAPVAVGAVPATTTTTTTAPPVVHRKTHERRVLLHALALAESTLVADVVLPQQDLSAWGSQISQIQTQATNLQGAEAQMEGDVVSVLASARNDQLSGTPRSAQTCSEVARVNADNARIFGGNQAILSNRAAIAQLAAGFNAHAHRLQADINRLVAAISRITWQHAAVALTPGAANQQLSAAQLQANSNAAQLDQLNGAIASVNAQAQRRMGQIAGAC